MKTTPEIFKLKMEGLRNDLNLDKEAVHSDMDDLLCEVLIELGYEGGVNFFFSTERWYA